MRSPYVNSPLEQWLGAVTAGTYRQTDSRERYAFDKVRDLWGQEEVSNPDSSDNDEEGGSEGYG
eukprot:14799145-Ditylum_brightwellii.AAC.1